MLYDFIARIFGHSPDANEILALPDYIKQEIINRYEMLMPSLNWAEMHATNTIYVLCKESLRRNK